jgi:putative ABC transport system ATP-binding protein
VAPLIQISDLIKTYRTGEVDVPVLRGIDLEVESGEYLAIVGRSGSGKSTLMNILGCLDTPTEGSYQLGGEAVAELTDDALSALRARTIGFVFQSFHLLKGLTVLENVALPMEYQRSTTRNRHGRSRKLLEMVGLGHRLGHRPNQLSGGERQRVAIARSLVNKPSLLLADEPTGNLDSAAQSKILELFAELQRQTKVTLIVVTHDPLVADSAKRVVRVSDGRVVSDGATGEGAKSK